MKFKIFPCRWPNCMIFFPKELKRREKINWSRASRRFTTNPRCALCNFWWHCPWNFIDILVKNSATENLLLIYHCINLDILQCLVFSAKYKTVAIFYKGAEAFHLWLYIAIICKKSPFSFKICTQNRVKNY
jgi:hypothetical protein